MVETNFHVCEVLENHLIKVINDMSIFRHSQEYGCSSIQREYSCCSPSVADIYRFNGLVRKYQGYVVCRREPKRIETAWIFSHQITSVFYETVRLRRLQILNL